MSQNVLANVAHRVRFVRPVRPAASVCVKAWQRMTVSERNPRSPSRSGLDRFTGRPGFSGGSAVLSRGVMIVR